MKAPKIKKILTTIGISNRKIRYYNRVDDHDQIQSSCFFAGLRDQDGKYFHEDGKDDKASMGIQVRDDQSESIANCFACNNSGTLKYLLNKAKKITNDEKKKKRFQKAIDIAGDVDVDTIKNQAERILTKDDEEAGDSNQYDPDEDKSETYDELELENFKRAIPNYLIEDRGFSVDICKKFEVHYDKDLKRAVIPLRNSDQDLAGLVGRTVLTEEFRDKLEEQMNDKPDWVARSYVVKYYNYLNFNKSRFLFGEHLLPNILKRIVVVEGCLDVMRLHSYGLESVVGVFGADISDRQQEKLLSMNVPIYLMLDPDNAGQRGLKKAIKSMADQTKVFKAKQFPNKDPGDLTKEQVKESLKKSQLAID